MRSEVTCFSCFSVPRAPQIDASSCVVRDNTITVTWRLPGEADSGGDSSSRPIERYDLEYRKTDRDSTLRVAGEACWEKVCDIIEPQVTISGKRSEVIIAWLQHH